MLNPSEKITILLSVSLAVRGNADFHLATIEHDEITEGFDSNTSNWYAHQNSSTPFVVQTTSGVINISTANQNVSPTGEVDENDHIAGGADRSTTMTMEEVTDNDRDVMSNLQGNRADLNVRDEITFWILPIAAAVGAVAGLGLVGLVSYNIILTRRTVRREKKRLSLGTEQHTLEQAIAKQHNGSIENVARVHIQPPSQSWDSLTSSYGNYSDRLDHRHRELSSPRYNYIDDGTHLHQQYDVRHSLQEPLEKRHRHKRWEHGHTDEKKHKRSHRKRDKDDASDGRSHRRSNIKTKGHESGRHKNR